jgi:stage V sporulation protein K
MSKQAGGLSAFIGSVLGEDAVAELKKAGLNLGEPANSDPANTGGAKGAPGSEMDFQLAGKSLGSATQAIRDRFSRAGMGGPSAAASAAPPADMVEAEAHKRDVAGGGGLSPTEGESARKLAAKATPELPRIKPSPELIKALKDGDVETFNSLRPAGRLDLTGINLSKRNLTGIDLRYCELARSDFSGTDLTGAQFQYANLDRAVFEGSTLNETKFFKAQMGRANLQKVVSAKGAQFAAVDLSAADLSYGNFDGVTLTDAKLQTGTLDHATFRGATLSRSIFARASLNRAQFDGALLDEVRLYQARGRDISFKDAILIGAEAVESQFSSSNQKVADTKILATTFEGAWVQDFAHRDAISPELLRNARKVGVPPEGLLPKTAQVDEGKVLIDGLPGTDKVLFDAAMAELNELIGLKAFKAMVPELLSHLKVSLARERLGLPGFDRKLHYCFVGPPGVGKTTCSRIMAKLFRSMGLLKEGQVIETDKSGFIAGYAGQSLSKTNELIDDSLGGALIADEIYALTESKNDDYAKDALVVLVKRLWDDRYNFAAFFLGYPKPMAEFIAANPGFDRRLAGIIELPPNSSGELVDIFKMKMKKLQLEHTPEMLAQVSVVMALHKAIKQEKFGNAGSVENFVEDLSKRMSQRLVREETLADKRALAATRLDDLPVEKYAKLPFTELPPLSELEWQDDEGRSYTFSQLPQSGNFPSLSPNSEARVRQLVEEHGLVDISTEH